jgi:hypothetical protein
VTAALIVDSGITETVEQVLSRGPEAFKEGKL